MLVFSSTFVNAAKEGRKLLDSLLVEYSDIKKDTNAVKLLNKLSIGYYILHSDSGEYYGNIGLELAKELGWEAGIASSKNCLATNYWAKSMAPEAMEYYLDALNIYEEIDDKQGLLKSYGNMAMIYSELGRYNKALEYYQKSISMASKLGDELGLARNYGNIGTVHMYHMDSDSALYYFNKSKVLNEKANRRNYLSINYLNIGVVYIDDSLYAQAYEYSMKSYEISKEIGNKRVLALSLANLGEIYIMHYFYPDKIPPDSDFIFKDKEDNLSKAIEYFEESRKIFDELDDKNNLMNICESLYDAYLVKGNYQQASVLKQKQNELMDTLTSEKAQKQIAMLDAKREIDLKDQQIRISELKLESKNELLVIIGIAFIILAIVAVILFRLHIQNRRINKKLVEQSKIISNQVATKDKFFSIIAHDLKNPISSMAKSIEMIHKDFDVFDKDEIKEFVSDLKKSSENVYALLEDLLTWSRSQRGMIEANKEKYNARDIAERAINQLESQATAKKISLINKIEENESVYIDANLTITLLRNLISNAIKFSNENSQVEVSLRKSTNGIISYEVTDHGIGIDTKTIDNLFRIDSAQSGIGTAGEKGTGLGLIVCKEFANKQNGDITVKSKQGNGSTFSFSFPNENGAYQ